jgi:hypothetical protein
MAGGGAGAILDMIIRLRDNSALLRKNRYFESRGHNIKTHAQVRNAHIKATPEQIQALRSKLKKQHQKNIILSVISLLASIAVTLALVYYLF